MRTTPRKKQIWPELWMHCYGELVIQYPHRTLGEYYDWTATEWKQIPYAVYSRNEMMTADYWEFICELRGQNEQGH